MKNNIYKLFTSFVTTFAVVASVAFIFVPQSAEAAFCSDESIVNAGGEAECFPDQATCNKEANFGSFCYEVSDAAWCKEPFDTARCNFASAEECLASGNNGGGTECFSVNDLLTATTNGQDSGDISVVQSPDGVITVNNTSVTVGGVPAAAAANGGGQTVNVVKGRFNYIPLEDTFINQENSELPELLKFIFRFGIAIVGMAALLMMVVGGATYVVSAGNNATAESAKKMIRDAALGLGLAFFSWIILFTINPDLVGIGENLEKLTAVSTYVSQNVGTGGGLPGVNQGGGTGTGTGTGTGNTTVPGAGYDPLEEARIRGLLDNAGVGVNRPITEACTSNTDTGCTSVAGLPDQTINALIAMKQECPNCTVVITGGSEEMDHNSHAPGVSAVDLRVNASVTNYINANGQQNAPIAKFGATTNAENWTITSGALAGARVVKETSPLHYHINW